MRKILIGAGGTGGHLLPAQQLGTLLSQNAKVAFAGFRLEESPYFSRENFEYIEIPSAPFKIGQWKCLGSLIKGFFKAFFYLKKEKPNYVFGFGSYHTAPLLLAAAILKIPIVLYEANRTLGRVNRWIAPFAKKIAVQFPLKTPHSKSVLVPLFPWILSEKKGQTKKDAKKTYGLDPEKPTILVFGGSQGASYLNEMVPLAADFLKDWQFLHLAGSEGGAEKTELRYQKSSASALVKSFETDMTLAYKAADVVICRSGAGTIAELISCQLPALLIPYPFATDDHQKINAEFFESLGGGKMVIQTDATVERLAREIQNIDLENCKAALKEYLKLRKDETPIEKVVE